MEHFILGLLYRDLIREEWGDKRAGHGGGHKSSNEQGKLFLVGLHFAGGRVRARGQLIPSCPSACLTHDVRPYAYSDNDSVYK